MKKKMGLSKQIGLGIVIFQFITSMMFMISLFMLNMFVAKYLLVIGAAVVILFVVSALGQYFAKKNAIFGKVVSVLISFVLLFLSYLMFTMNSTMQDITQTSGRVETIQVVVLVDDPAQTISDAADYNFGVQYQFKGDEIRKTVDVINKELDKEITSTQYESVQEQVDALFAKEVGAIIYNDAYTAVLEEEIENYSDKVRILHSYSIEMEPQEIVVEEEEVEEEKEDHTFTMYISGIDVYGNINKTSRSDVNMLAVVNTETHQILLVTTPRDYYVPIPGISNGQRDKLTHAGLYGVEASMATLSDLYGVYIDYYARVNFTSVVKIIDALGGITVYSEQAFRTSGVQIHEGYNDLDGEAALVFSRERYDLAGGDFQRGKNQQEVIKGIIRKAISPAILTGAGDILKSVSGNIDTNMEIKEIQELVKDQLATMASWEVKTLAAEGHGDYQSCYSSPGWNLYVAWPDEDSVAMISSAISAVKNGEMLNGSDTIE